MEVDLDLALAMCTTARQAAAELGALVSVAVVDAGGHLVAFTRMDGAEIAGPVLARDKAFTAVPLWSGDRVVGGVGVSGGSGEQDLAAATRAAAVFVHAEAQP